MRIAITPGEPAGIGAELLVRYAQEDTRASDEFDLVVIASKALLSKTAKQLGLAIELVDFEPDASKPDASKNAAKPGRLCVLDIPLTTPSIAGVLDTHNSVYVLNTLTRAADGCVSGEFQALVTGPVHKGVMNDAGIAFTGHTEFLAKHSQRDKVVMMLATDGLRVALTTTHLPLKDVSAAITKDNLARTLDILHHDLVTQFNIPNPRILVAGLNPHAGEGGHMGTEEIDTIIPVLSHLRDRGMNLIGPLPADTLFTPHHLKETDAVLAMYHDQGLPVLKYKGFGNAVNITLGLPYIRTSVDHGTALDLTNKGIADLGSFRTALAYATRMCQHRAKRDA